MSDEPVPSTFPSGIPRPTIALPEVNPEVLVVTGMSGAGRTKAAAVLADLGWYVVDNLPPQMLGGLVSMLGDGVAKGEDAQNIAAVVDVRGRQFFQDLEAVLDDFAAQGVAVRLLFLDASDETLVRRFEEARRPHPLQGDGTLLEGIAKERLLLDALRTRANAVIDTSSTNVHELREIMTAEAGGDDRPLTVNIVSFGFKSGIPADADFVVDVRFLHNPHWVPALRALTGLDHQVRDYVLSSDGAAEFVADYAELLSKVLGRYRDFDKRFVTVGVGCTGGQHRSVAIAKALGEELTDRNIAVRVRHRDRPTA